MEDYLKPSFTNFELDSEIMFSKVRGSNPNLDDIEKRLYVFLSEYFSTCRKLVLNESPESALVIYAKIEMILLNVLKTFKPLNSKSFPVNSLLLAALDKDGSLNSQDDELWFLQKEFVPGKSGLIVKPQRYAVFLERVLRFWVMCTNNMAVVEYLRGNYTSAINHLMSAITVRTKVFSYYLSYFHFLGLEANLAACLLKDDRSAEADKVWADFVKGLRKLKGHCEWRHGQKAVARLLYSEHPLDFLIINEY